jgi:hypothetical protein
MEHEQAAKDGAWMLAEQGLTDTCSLQAFVDPWKTP